MRLMIQVELLHPLGLGLLAAQVDLFRDREHHEQAQRERNAVFGGDLLGEQVGDGHRSQHQRGDAESNRNLAAADAEIQWHFVFLIGALEAQHGHA